MRAISTDALLLVDKPSGITSHDVVAVARRALGTRRVGHAGTLDPFATGLLVLLSGRGTRLMRYLPGEPKVYEATIRLGVATDTDDLTGTIIEEAPLPTPSSVAAAMMRLTGRIAQLPPQYSAKHVGGERAYAVARRGERAALAPVEVTVHRWELLAASESTLVVRIVCGAGTYIRALARDLGTLAGSAAHLTALRRTEIGPFNVADAMSLEALRGGALSPRPIVAALHDWPSQVLSAADAERVARGVRVAAAIPDARHAALLDADRQLLAVARREGESWQPEVVLADG